MGFIVQGTAAFGLPLSQDIHTTLGSLSSSVSALPSFFASSGAVAHIHYPESSFLAASTDSSPNALEIVSSLYRQELQKDPLKTKVITGIFLAVVGDALAQSRQPEPYNVDRAASFAIFDGCYRAVQQFTYPPMMKLCSGKFITSLLAAAGAASVSADQVHLLASVEQTLVSQLVIIPTLYYPVFYAITGAVQGLTVEETVQRAKDTFVPLMKRNLQFWIPVQFFAFAFVEENLQIPILIVCGLVWTIILSISAGAAKTLPAEDSEAIEMDSVVLQDDGAYLRISESSDIEMKTINVGERLRRLTDARIEEKDFANK